MFLYCNWSGSENLKPLVIGKSKRPRCFKRVNSLESDYEVNKKAWMTSAIFEQWLLKLDKCKNEMKPKIILFIDNCIAHPSSIQKKLKFITLAYFPSNMTSKLQPLEQGIIKSVKVHYQQRYS